jgi:hypothetical protein
MPDMLIAMGKSFGESPNDRFVSWTDFAQIPYGRYAIGPVIVIELRDPLTYSLTVVQWLCGVHINRKHSDENCDDWRSHDLISFGIRGNFRLVISRPEQVG